MINNALLEGSYPSSLVIILFLPIQKLGNAILINKNSFSARSINENLSKSSPPKAKYILIGIETSACKCGKVHNSLLKVKSNITGNLRPHSSDVAREPRLNSNEINGLTWTVAENVACWILLNTSLALSFSGKLVIVVSHFESVMDDGVISKYLDVVIL